LHQKYWWTTQWSFIRHGLAKTVTVQLVER
jgi:hypothetical protein